MRESQFERVFDLFCNVRCVLNDNAQNENVDSDGNDSNNDEEEEVDYRYD